MNLIKRVFMQRVLRIVRMWRFLLRSIFLGLLLMLFSDVEAHGHHAHDYYYGRYVGHSAPDYWRVGGWRHVSRGGRYGWWWVVGSAWYFYPVPVYPYPAYVSTVTVVTDEFPHDTEVEVVPPVHHGFSSTPYSFYCDQPEGYYPDVSVCDGAWREVPASPTSRTRRDD